MKKFISFLIAAVMLVSMIPFASATDSYTYYFTSASHNNSGSVSAENYTPEGTAQGYQPWGFVCVTAKSDAVAVNNAHLDWRFKGTAGIEYNPDKGLLSPSLVLEIDIPEAGTYATTFTKPADNSLMDYMPLFEAYLIKKPTDPEAWKANCKENLLNLSTADRFAMFNNHRYAFPGLFTYEDSTSPVTVTEPGRYYLIFIVNGARASVLDKLASDANIPFFTWINSLTLTKTAAQDSTKDKVLNNDGDASAPVEEGKPTAATVAQLQAVLGGEVSTKVESLPVDGDGYVTVTADATAADGSKFLYWAKGLKSGEGKKVILPQTTENNVCTATFKPETGMNYIIAVYGSGTATEEKYFNANGQLLDWKQGDDMPTMAGYGEATDWTPAGNGINVAAYDEPTETFTVNVEYKSTKCVTTEIEKEPITDKKYGELVTVTAPRRFDSVNSSTLNNRVYDYDYEAFNYWEKDGKIVSFDRTYSFYAYEDCTLTAVYNVFEPISKSLRKIILDSTADNNIMAEFIGLSDAVEKGIIFGGTTLDTATVKSAMTTGGSQYVVENDKNYTDYAGYAILSDGSVIYSK